MYLGVLLALSAALAHVQGEAFQNFINDANETSLLNSTLQDFPDLQSALGDARNITILAPSNQAFNSFKSQPGASALLNNKDVLQALLTYHILNGTYHSFDWVEKPNFLPSRLVNNPQYRNLSGSEQVVEIIRRDGNASAVSGLGLRSNIARADIDFDGGVIHIMDSLLTLPLNVSATAGQLNLTSFAGSLIAANSLNSTDYLSKVTIFAPNNNAFQAVGGNLQNLSAEEVQAVLNYHIVPDTLGYSDVLGNNTKLKTQQGNEVTIRTEGNNTVFVNGARVVVPNIITNNGILHVVDAVLNPNNTGVTPDEAAATASPQFSPASSASQLPYTGSAPAVTGVPNGGGVGPSDAGVGLLAAGSTGGGGGGVATATSGGGGSSTTAGGGSSTTAGGGSPTTAGGGASPTSTQQGSAGKHGSSFGVAGFAVGMIAWGVYLV